MALSSAAPVDPPNRITRLPSPAALSSVLITTPVAAGRLDLIATRQLDLVLRDVPRLDERRTAPEDIVRQEGLRHAQRGKSHHHVRIGGAGPVGVKRFGKL